MMPGNFWENPNEFKAPPGWLCENIWVKWSLRSNLKHMLQPWWTISFKVFFFKFSWLLEGFEFWDHVEIPWYPSIPCCFGERFCTTLVFPRVLWRALEVPSTWNGKQKWQPKIKVWKPCRRSYQRLEVVLLGKLLGKYHCLLGKWPFNQRKLENWKDIFFWVRWMNLEVLKPPLMARLIVFQKLQALQPIVPRLQWLQISGFIQTEDEKSLLTSKRNKCPNLGRTC